MSELSLHELGWRPMDQAHVPPQARPARVMSQGKGAWHVNDGTAVLVVRARSRSLEPLPVTGDWVALTDESGTDFVECVLPRRTTLARAEAGGRSEEQVIAANVDLVAICTPSDDVNLRRLERELTAVWSSGATPLVVVTKADLVDDPWQVVASVQTACVGADVVAVSSQLGDGLDAVTSRLDVGQTMALIGPSGVGKSTLVNALVGSEVMATTQVRSDGKGRHTTTSRHLIALPGGGLLLDTPGMREFAPWSEGEGLAETFADIEDLAEECRFTDCRHESEPGCRVLQAAADDEQVAARLESWRRLQRELAWLARRHDTRLQNEERRRWAAITRSARSSIRP